MIESLNKIRIGTRGSPLALTQTEMVRDALSVVAPDIETEVVIIKTSGDWKPSDGETRLSAENGGKGQFAKELEEALLAGAIDIAVHSMKDMETFLPDGLSIPVMLPREDARDALLFRAGLEGVRAIEDLPQGATIGTASVRRQAFLLSKRPDLKVVPMRGNVQTRIEKVRSGQIESGPVDATLLAIAGLKRLDLEGEADLVLSSDEMLPAAGQGAVGIEIKSSNDSVLAIIGQLNCANTLMRVSAERAALAVLDGSCHTPIGAHATLESGEMNLRLAVAALDGSNVYGEQDFSDVETLEQAEAFGAALGEKLKARLPAGLLVQRIENEARD